MNTDQIKFNQWVIRTNCAELERQSERVECARCSGSGVIPAAEKRIGTWGCKDCGGTGKAARPRTPEAMMRSRTISHRKALAAH